MYDTLSVDGHLGIRSENTIDALKERLGVTQLEVVVLNDVGEYRELLTETMPPEKASIRRSVALMGLLVTLVLYLAISMAFHPGTGLDHLAHHISVEVH